MLSRLQAISQLSRALGPRLAFEGSRKALQNVTIKRWSGHNAMEIRPSNADWNYIKNWFHFYFLVGLIPLSVITTIINIRANPVLSEVPDGYEPRYYEYFKHPVSRFAAKYLYESNEKDEEVILGILDWKSNDDIIRKVIQNVEAVMKFYNDHRSMYFEPRFADYYRIGREESSFVFSMMGSEANTVLEEAYDPDITQIPVEGYPDGPID